MELVGPASARGHRLGDDLGAGGKLVAVLAVVVDDLDPRQLRVLGDLYGPSSSSLSSSLSS